MIARMAYACLSISLFISMLLGACNFMNKDQMEHKIAMRVIPVRLNPWKNLLNTDHLISFQLYYPLCSRDDAGVLISQFFDVSRTVAKNSSFRVFQFCLKNGVHFTSGKRLSVDDLETSLKNIHQYKPNLPEIQDMKKSGDCLQVELQNPAPSYFDYLSGPSSTILDRNTLNDPFPSGFGPYRIEKRSAERLSLIANEGEVKGDLKKLVFIKFESTGKSLADGVQNWNHILWTDIPKTVTERQRRIDLPILKSYAVVVNWKNAAERKAFAACLDIEEFKEISGFGELKRLPGFLPPGLLGYEVSFAPKRDAAMCRIKSKGKVYLNNFRQDYSKSLREFFKKHENDLPINVVVRDVSVEDSNKAIFNREPYVDIVGFDTTGSAYSSTGETVDFFESFYNNERIISEPLLELKQLVDKALHERFRQNKEELYRAAHRCLLDSGYVIPMGQFVQKQYYPASFENIRWLDAAGGIPDFSEIRVSLWGDE